MLLVAAGGWFVLRQFRQPLPSAAPQPAQPVQPAPAPAAGAGRKVRTPPFTALTAPVTPAFLSNVATTPDVKIALYYEGDERTPTDEIWYAEKKTINNEQGEAYLLMPSSIDTSVRYGPTEYEIFKNQESHAYQGIPVVMRNAASKYALQYVGLKINDLRMIGQLSVEAGVDYQAADDGDVLDIQASPRALLAPLSEWLSPSAVYACGPGLYLRPIGRSTLVAAQIENGIAWYKLEKPVALYNLPLDFCDTVPAKAATGKKPEVKKEDEVDEPDDQAYCAPIKDFTGGQLRFHVLYRPSGVEGPLQVQVVNFIFQNEDGRYFQPTIGANFDRYYKAFLVDRACFQAGTQPADCIRP
jgi:hypothetical protein